MTKLNGQPFEKPESSYTAEIGNVRSGERGLFLFELKPSTFEAGAAIGVTARITFDDPQTAQRVSREIREQAPFLANASQTRPRTWSFTARSSRRWQRRKRRPKVST